MLKSHKNKATNPNLKRIKEVTERQRIEPDLSHHEPNQIFVMWTDIKKNTPAIGRKIVTIALGLIGVNVAPEFLPLQELAVEIVNYLLIALLGYFGITYTADKAREEAVEANRK